MKLEHVALWVKDLERAKDFFIRYFGGRAGKRYENTRTGFCSYFISFEEGARLEIMSGPAAEEGAPGRAMPMRRSGPAPKNRWMR